MKTPDPFDGSEPTLMIPPNLADTPVFDGSSTTIMYVPAETEEKQTYDGSETTRQYPALPVLDPLEETGSRRCYLGNQVLNPLLFIQEYVRPPTNGKGFLVVLEDALRFEKKVKEKGKKDKVIVTFYDVPVRVQETPQTNENTYSIPLYKTDEQDLGKLGHLVFAEFRKTGQRRHWIYLTQTDGLCMMDIGFVKKVGTCKALIQKGTYYETSAPWIRAHGRKAETMLENIEKKLLS